MNKSIKTFVLTLLVIIPLLISFSACNNKVKNDLYYYNLKGKIKIIIETSFNINIQEETDSISKEEFVDEKIIRFNEYGNFNEMIINDENGELIYKTVFNNKKNVKKGHSSYEYNGKLAFKSKLSSDFRGRNVKQKIYNDIGILVDTHYNKFDKSGNIIEQIREIKDKEFVEKDVMRYDENSFKVSEEHYDNFDILTYKLKFQNDSFGNVIKKERYDLSNTLVTENSYSYKFDKKNNWIIALEYENGKLVSLKKRIIEYY